jgi:Protein of unknown function (DUF3568)
MNTITAKNRLRIVVALLVLAATPGCFLVAVGAAGAAGAGTVAYVRGELDATLGSPFPAVVDATARAVSQLQFAPVKETKDSLNYETISRTADDRKVDITITNEASNLTVVHIRIGIFGDETESRAILDKIKANL